MSSELLTHFATKLSSLGYGTLGVDIFANNLPPTPTVSLGIISQGGYSTRQDPTRRESFQILYRTTSIGSGSVHVDNLHKDLTEGNGFNLFPGFCGSLNLQGEPGTFYKDAANFPVFSLNYVFITTTRRLRSQS